MEEKIKEIIASFTKIPIEQINSSTVIDRSAVNSSIMLHRMYARLAEQGVVLENYADIKNVGNLLQRINGNGISNVAVINKYADFQKNTAYSNNNAAQNSVGIDIEEIDSMPVVNDFREDEFYKMNFSAQEISYCLLQQNPYASFAGLFAAKEAIIKADNKYRSNIFNTIIIDHLPEGKPLHNEFHLSISHTNQFAIAVAVQLNQHSFNQPSMNVISKESNKNQSSLLIILLSLLLSVIAIIIALKH